MQKNSRKITNLRYIKGKQAGRTYHTQHKVHHTPLQATFIFYTNNNMTNKKKALIEAICDEFGFDYPERDYEDPEDTRTTDEIYEDALSEYNFTS